MDAAVDDVSLHTMKRDLYFSKPLMNGAGSLGFFPDFRSLRESPPKQSEGGGDFGSLNGLGAFVTNPFSLRPRLPTSQPAILEYPGGFLLHTGLPNPGLNAGVRKYASKWDKSDIPVIVHLMADRPEETRNMVRMLEEIENVMAVELGFAPLLTDDIILLTLEMCLGELPLILSLPVERVLSLGPRLMQEGAQAISIAPPRGALNAEDGKIITGRLFGPSLFPQSLDVVRSAATLGIPVIGSGGVWTKENADAMLSVGALAVQVDAALWNPASTFSVPAP
jgi:dihydroorotate dehydrogenase (NAD+) catalytic subunit